MANRYFQQFVAVPQHGLVMLSGSVSIAADASVSASSFPFGTITKTGTGAYTLTLADKYSSVVSIQATLEAAVAVDLVPQVTSADVSSAKTVVFSLNTGATPTNPSAVCKLHILLLVKNSSITP